MTLCPCGLEKKYEQCCGRFIDKKQSPQTPEHLMRSRYSAFSQINTDYIKNTMKGTALLNFNESEVQKWASSIHWIGLKVIQTWLDSSTRGFVEFSARFIENKRVQTIHEQSEFHLVDKVWYYVEGTNMQLPTNKPPRIIPRTGPCPCGSGRKFKNCHDE